MVSATQNRPQTRSDRRQLVLPVATTILAGRDGQSSRPPGSSCAGHRLCRYTVRANSIDTRVGSPNGSLRKPGGGRAAEGNKLGFTQFKRRRQGNLQVGGTARPGVPECRGQRPTVRNLPTPATGGDAPGRWHPRRSATVCRTKRPCAGSWGAVSATRGRPGWSRRRVPVGRAWCGRWRDRTTGVVSPTPRWVRTSWKVTSSCQRSTNHSRIWVGSAAGVGTEQGLSGEGALGVSDQHPANEDGGLAGAVPDRRQ